MRRFKVHKFLKAVGFSNIRKKDLDIILEEIIEHPNVMKVTKDSAGNEFAEILRFYGDNIGIMVRGSYDENDEFQINYYVPFSTYDGVSTLEQIDIEKHHQKLRKDLEIHRTHLGQCRSRVTPQHQHPLPKHPPSPPSQTSTQPRRSKNDPKPCVASKK